MPEGPPPLRVTRVASRGFRNLEGLDIAPGPRFNVISGENGAGKSNLLEALHMLCAGKSFRGARADDMIATGQAQALLKARLSGTHASEVLALEMTRGKPRKLTLDGKRPKHAAELRARAPMVVFHPGHLSLSTGSAEVRRAFLDDLLVPTEPLYAEALTAYEKALRSRNRLLKEEGVPRARLRPYDVLLARHGALLVERRRALVETLAPRVEGAFREIAGESIPIEARYAPRVGGDGAAAIEGALLEALTRAFELDRARGFSADGPHSDELTLRFGEASVRNHASQGQHRALSLSMKIAELGYVTERLGKVPVLLLDDVTSELDRARNRRLFERLAGLGGQVFLTTTHPEFILLSEERVDFHVSGGVVKRA